MIIIFDISIIIIMNFDDRQEQSEQYEQTDQPEQLDQQLFHQHFMNRMDAIERKLDLILQKLDGSIIKNCDKMGTHIDFVNGVYATVKVPLNYISNKMHKIINPLGSPKDLPLLNDGLNNCEN